MKQRPGIFAVILGPDGSGKSTLVDRMLALSMENYRGAWRFHWRPGLLPKPGRRSRNDDSRPEVVAAPPRDYAYGRTVSLARYLYFLTDFVLGYWLLIFPRRAHGQLVVGERWYYDVIINPQRYGFRVPAWLLHLGGRLVPSPDLTILLEADARAIHARKPELTERQITDQLTAMRALLPDPPRGARITTGGSIEESLQALQLELRKAARLCGHRDDWRTFPRIGTAKVYVAEADSMASALRLYNPYSPAGRIAKKLARFAPRSMTTGRTACGSSLDELTLISEMIRFLLGEEALTISFATGTPGPHRKLTAQVTHGDRVIAYVKVAQSPAVAALLQQEADTLRSLDLGANGQLTAPRVIAETENHGYRLLVLSAPTLKTCSRSLDLEQHDIVLIDALAPAKPATVSLDAAWREIMGVNTGNDEVIRDALAAADVLLGAKGVRVGNSHGDFAPWNTLRLEDGRLYVFDWEYASNSAPLLCDLFHRVFMPAWLVRRLTPEAAIANLMCLRLNPLVKPLLQRLEISDREFPAYILLYLARQGLRASQHGTVPDYIRSCLRVLLMLEGRPGRRLRVLVSAYACEPDKGSEPGVGWHWVDQISKRADVWVVTRKNNRASIEAALRKHPNPNVHFAYVDLPRWASFWKKGGRGIRTYYYLWQFFALREARKLHRKVAFDFGHHVTFVNDWLWSFMALLPFPFVWGPVGSNTKIPRQLLPHRTAQLQELIRHSIQRVMRVIDPLYWATVLRASVILVLTREVSRQFPLRLLPAKRFLVEPAIAVTPLPERSQAPGAGCQILYVGKFLYIKCPHLVIDAFARAARDHSTMRLVMVGTGPEEQRLRAQAEKSGLKQKITFAGWLSREQVLNHMADSCMLLFPSAEGAGMVVLEAMASGLPVVCLDQGGPGQMVAPHAGVRVPVGPYEDMVKGLAEALHQLCNDPALRARLAAGARQHAGTRYAWDGKQQTLGTAYALALARRLIR